MAARPTSWKTVITVLVVLGLAGSLVIWRVSLPALDRQIAHKRTSVKGLYLKGSLPPDHKVVEYLKARSEALETQYHNALDLVMPAASLADAQANPQLYFQQRVHEVRQTVERLATTRGMAVPEQLGLPKELPPADAVPRFLIQVELVEQTAALLMPVPGLVRVTSFKVEDPSSPAADDANQALSLMQLPIRVHLQCSLEALATVLNLLERAKPLIDLQSLRVASSAEPTPSGGAAPGAPPTQPQKALEVELLVARYLVQQPQPEPPAQESPRRPRRKEDDERESS